MPEAQGEAISVCNSHSLSRAHCIVYIFLALVSLCSLSVDFLYYDPGLEMDQRLFKVEEILFLPLVIRCQCSAVSARIGDFANDKNRERNNQ